MTTPNDFILWPFRYIREFVPTSNVLTNPQYKNIVDNVQIVPIVVTAIPDGMSLTQLHRIDSTMITRLNIFAREALSDKFLTSIDELYGDGFYPLTKLYSPVAFTDNNDPLPYENFYAVVNKPIAPQQNDFIDTRVFGGEFVEYRYLQQRQFFPTLVWDQSTRAIYKFVMPNKELANQPVVGLIMPENFTRTGLNSGYWNFNGLIFSVFARNCILVGGNLANKQDSQFITSINNEDPRTVSTITNFLSKIGMHKIESTAVNQIYASDKYLTVVIGSLNNLAL